ncbi:MAG: DUF1638 domain-containing protein [Acidimicrobiales bacterium]|nr:DUF1638 domain-containing protein [Acidimicrobiales bacterium]
MLLPNAPRRTLVLSCAALASDIRAVVNTSGWDHVDFEYLPANYHVRPEKIVPAIEPILAERADDYDHILIGYGDCGTGGHLDRLLQHYPHAERLPGDHCYAFFTGVDEFLAEHESEIGTFYLTDFLARHQDALVFGALGLDDHPELIPMYFGNYTRVLYIAQSPTPELEEAAKQCATKLNLAYAQSNVGRGLLESTLVKIRTAA